MDALTKTLLTVLLSALASGGLVWFLMDRRALLQRIADLEKHQTNGPEWAAGMKLDHRAQMASIATLSELALGDLLDATIRLSPEAAQRAIKKHAPHLFWKDDIE